METKTTLPIDSILFQNKTWSIELLAGRKELVITNGNNICYAYFDREKQVLFFDRIICPKYIRIRALQVANNSGMIDIYNPTK